MYLFVCYGGHYYFKITIMKRLSSVIILLLKNNNFNKTIHKSAINKKY